MSSLVASKVILRLTRQGLNSPLANVTSRLKETILYLEVAWIKIPNNRNKEYSSNMRKLTDVVGRKNVSGQRHWFPVERDRDKGKLKHRNAKEQI